MTDSLHDSSNKPERNKYRLASSVLASLAFMVVGYDAGVWPAAVFEAFKDLNVPVAQLVALLLTNMLFGILGVAAALRTADWIGRRYALIFSCAIMFAGFTLMGFARSFGFLMVARIVGNTGVGYALVAASTYSAEIALFSSRSFLTSLPELLFNQGTLFGGIAGYGFSKCPPHLGCRRIMYGISAVPSISICLIVLFFPESPWWLVTRGRLDEARRVLDKTSDSIEESQLRLAKIKAEAGITQDVNTGFVPVPNPFNFCSTLKELLIRPAPFIRNILITTLGMIFFQQAVGINTIALFGDMIFKRAGVKRELHRQLISVAIGILGIATGLLATRLVDKMGRRILLLYSVGGMVFSLMGVAISLTVIQHHSDHKMLWATAMCIMCALLCVAFFSIGLSPAACAYTFEILPQRLSGQWCSLLLWRNMAIATAVLTYGIVTVTICLLLIFGCISFGGVFFLHSGIAILAWILIYLFLPETKGVSAEEIETLFGGLGSFCKDRIRNLCNRK